MGGWAGRPVSQSLIICMDHKIPGYETAIDLLIIAASKYR